MSSTTNAIVNFEPSTQLVFQKTDQDSSAAGETNVIQDTLKISNLSPDQDVLFRVQTTAPLTYRVKPSHGRIAVGETAVVQVVMVAESNKVDKFLIKYAPIDPNVSSDGNFLELFKTVESNTQEHRLKCSVLQADGTPLTYGNSAAQDQVAPAPTASPANESVAAAVAAVPVSVTEPQQAPKAEPVQESAASTPTKAAAADPRDAKIASLTSRNQDLQRQVEELQKLVAKNAAAPASGSAGQVPPEWVALLNSQTGFPPVLVILIALFSFLVGLLF